MQLIHSHETYKQQQHQTLLFYTFSLSTRAITFTATSEDCNLYHKHYIWALGYQTSTKALNHRENLQDSPQQELISDMDEIWKGNISAEF